VPESLGGKNTIPLCQLCHDKVHHVNKPRNISLSNLTKLGLQKRKQQGFKLGNPNLKESRQKSIQVRKCNAKDFKMRIRPIALQMIADGCNASQVANNLNQLGIKTVRNELWKSTNISYLVNS
jgi:DNA invertase Pin-like site-specific DNA recombinase